MSGKDLNLTSSTTLAKVESATCYLDQSTVCKYVEFSRFGVGKSTRVTAFETTKVSTKGQDSLSTKYAWHTALTTSGNNSQSCGGHLESPSSSTLDLPDLYINFKSYKPNAANHHDLWHLIWMKLKHMSRVCYLYKQKMCFHTDNQSWNLLVTAHLRLLLRIIHVISVVCLLYFCGGLIIFALWSPAGKGLTPAAISHREGGNIER